MQHQVGGAEQAGAVVCLAVKQYDRVAVAGSGTNEPCAENSSVIRGDLHLLENGVVISGNRGCLRCIAPG